MSMQPGTSADTTSAEATPEELDFSSEKFNPLKALYSKHFKLPFKNIKPLDNIAAFESRIKRAGGTFDADITKIIAPVKQNKDPQVPEIDESKYHITSMGRVFLKEQAPVSRPKSTKHSRNLLTRIEHVEGPISLLKSYKDNRTHVKIFTRKEHGIRGFVTGYIELFDKHFNISLSDCHEVWKRRKYAYSETNVMPQSSQNCSKLIARMGIEIPELKVKSINRKYVECSRNVPQMMIRGEQIVLILIANAKK